MSVRSTPRAGLSALVGLTGVTRLASRRRWRSADPRSISSAPRVGPLVVGCGVYEDGKRLDHHGPLEPAEALRIARERPGRFAWVGLFEPTAGEMGVIATHFGLHPVAADDAVQAHQRPKLDIIGDVTFLVLKSAVYVGNHADVGVGEVVETGEVMLLVGPDFVITVRHGQACELMDVRRQLEQTPLMLAHGPMSVLHAVVERVVGDYDSVADAITDDIDELEVRVFESVDGTDVQRVYQLKRELMEFSRAVRPLVRPLQILSSGKHPGVGDDLAAYLRDVEEEVNRVSERIAGDDELVVNLLGATLSQLALRQNDDMRKMSAWLAIGAVPTTIGAIYGMNFDHMPELHTQYGYFVCLGGMGVLMGWLFRTFKRSGWL